MTMSGVGIRIVPAQTVKPERSAEAARRQHRSSAAPTAASDSVVAATTDRLRGQVRNLSFWHDGLLSS
jgi:hypothetical protein